MKMRFYEAKTTDILRSTQRDEAYIQQFTNEITEILKLTGNRNYFLYRRCIPIFANFWYYLLTSASNLQTLGEEYAGILRTVNNNKIPSFLRQASWIFLYVGGDFVFDRLLYKLKKEVDSSQNLTETAKSKLVKSINFLQSNKATIIKLNQALFYIHGRYYNVSNRLTGVKYVLLRDWLQNASMSASFKILGYCSMFYLSLILIQSRASTGEENTDTVPISTGTICVLCTENRKNTAATPCGHLYCWNCIYESLKYNSHCPVCRENIKPSRIVLLQNYE